MLKNYIITGKPGIHVLPVRVANFPHHESHVFWLCVEFPKPTPWCFWTRLLPRVALRFPAWSFPTARQPISASWAIAQPIDEPLFQQQTFPSERQPTWCPDSPGYQRTKQTTETSWENQWWNFIKNKTAAKVLWFLWCTLQKNTEQSLKLTKDTSDWPSSVLFKSRSTVKSVTVLGSFCDTLSLRFSGVTRAIKAGFSERSALVGLNTSNSRHMPMHWM